MKYKLSYLILTGLILTSLFINSCKKEDKSNIPHLLTTGAWQLASVQVQNYIGDSNISTDTLNTDCDTTQLFTFNMDNTCTYTNFGCKEQPTATGTWSITANKLFLNADITCQDNAGTLKPFLNAQIINLGQFSLVLQTGDIDPYYSATQKRTITRYGFIRQRIPLN